jgi:hypothetical protein
VSGFESATVPAEALFIEGNEILLIFPSVADAEASLEAIDVEEGTYPAAYGPEGEPYDIRAEGPWVRITRGEGPNRPGELKGLLCSYLEGCEDPADADETLDALVARAWAIEHDHWQRCDAAEARAEMPIWAIVIVILVAVAGLYYALR